VFENSGRRPGTQVWDGCGAMVAAHDLMWGVTALDHPAVDTFAAALRRAGMTEAADGIRILAAEVRTASSAAAALDVPVGAIANSLVFRVDTPAQPAGRPLLVLTSGAHRVDTNRLAALIGGGSVRKADPEFVRTHTGQAIGGVAPAGHPQPIQTLVDEHLARYEVVWAAAGHPRSVFPTTFESLLALTGGTAEDVAEHKDDPVS
jgi:prolyl-tRNA editing enzyme YbaK/EbsC (Cys-tRNA(Pro) deacylase)